MTNTQAVQPKTADYVPFVIGTAAAAAISSFFQPGPWCDALNKPWWTPPDWVFPVAWTPLYILIVIAGTQAYRAERQGLAIKIWAVQLLLNAGWSAVMFGTQNVALALFC